MMLDKMLLAVITSFGNKAFGVVVMPLSALVYPINTVILVEFSCNRILCNSVNSTLSQLDTSDSPHITLPSLSLIHSLEAVAFPVR